MLKSSYEGLWRVMMCSEGLWWVMICYEGLWWVMMGCEALWCVMSVTGLTAFQPKLKGVCPKGVGSTPCDIYIYIYIHIFIYHYLFENYPFGPHVFIKYPFGPQFRSTTHCFLQCQVHLTCFLHAEKWVSSSSIAKPKTCRKVTRYKIVKNCVV